MRKVYDRVIQKNLYKEALIAFLLWYEQKIVLRITKLSVKMEHLQGWCHIRANMAETKALEPKK